MMRFMHFDRRGGSFGFPHSRVSAVLLAVLAGGCSAEISRFDPGFNLADNKKETTTASLASDDTVERGPRYLGNETYKSYDSGYSQNSGGYDQSNYNQTNYNQGSHSQGSSQGGYQTSGYDGGANGSYNNTPPANADDGRYDQQPSSTNYGSQSGYGTAGTGDAIEVQPGDTLYGISRRHNVTITDLMQTNGLTNTSLKAGQRLYLPAGYAARPSQTRTVMAPEAPPAAAPPPAVSPDMERRYAGNYTVRAGDSVYGISRMYNVPVRELQEVNGISDPRSVKIGAVLRVPGNGGYPDYSTPQQPTTTRVAVAPVVPSTHQPTVINGNGTQVASRTDDVNTGALGPSASGSAQPSRSVASSDKLRWPVRGRIISGFGQRNDGTHNDGINLSVPLGTPVHAAEGGTVAYAGAELKGYGNLILVRHDNGWVTAYAHNDQMLVQRGDKVQRGQVIARAGRTGSVDQPQLHFELRQGSKPVDPVPFLDRI